MNLGASVRVNKCGVCMILGVVIVMMMLYRYGGDNEKRDTSDVVSLKSLLSAAIDAAERGGKIVYDVREKANLNEQSKGKTLENANDPITNGDLMSHVAMFYSLQRAFPAVKIVSEEHTLKPSDPSNIEAADIVNPEVGKAVVENAFVPVKDVTVWIDPLDATQEYTENLREYVTTMVCVAVKGYATIGVIHKPFMHFTAWGWAGKGVSPSLEHPKKAAGDVTRVVISRSHSGTVSALAMSAFGDKTNVTLAGGAGFKTLEVISGRADLYLHTTLIKKWDLCAGNAILNALDGKMTTLEGKVIDYGNENEIKNAGGLLAAVYDHPKYLDLLQKASKKEGQTV